MYRRQLVWTGYGWQYVDVFIPVTTGYYNGYYTPWTGVNYILPGQIRSASYHVGGIGGRFLR